MKRGTQLTILLFLGILLLSACSLQTEPRNTKISSPLSNLTNTETNSSLENASFGATGDNINDFGACSEDAQTYCSGLYTGDWSDWALEHGYTNASWKYALVDCLGQNRNVTTQACDDSLDRRQVLNEEMVAACADDQRTYCSGVEPDPGSEPLVDCLKANRDSLSETCREALDAHENAKSSA